MMEIRPVYLDCIIHADISVIIGPKVMGSQKRSHPILLLKTHDNVNNLVSFK